MTGTVLITRDPGRASAFRDLLEKRGLRVICRSFIQTVPLEIPDLPEVDRVFFTSPACVRHFFGQNPKLPPHIGLAAPGEGTAEEIRKFDREVDFIGSGDIKDAVRQFKRTLKEDEKVLIPRSDRSMRRLQKELDPSAFHEFILYRTEILPEKIREKLDVAIFTSPGNARGFAEGGNAFPRAVVSMGKSTFKALEEYGATPVMSSGYSPEDLAGAALRALK